MNNQFGLSHFLAQADVLAITLLSALIIMSLCTWTLAFKRLSEHWAANKHYEALNQILKKEHLKTSDFLKSTIFTWAFLQQTSINTNPGAQQDFLLDQTASQLDNGQIVLASIAATAPFVGLLGTVWGIYHALLAVAASGQASIEKIMGPVGETLLMTALGLMVALPAVVVYNLINRSNAKRMLQVQRILQALPAQMVKVV